MKKWTYYVSNLSFEIPVDDGYETFEADVKVDACEYLYGDDADGNRGVYVTDRDVTVQAVRNSNGESVTCTDVMEEEISTIINEKGADLE